jgi:hypothetical protein
VELGPRCERGRQGNEKGQNAAREGRDKGGQEGSKKQNHTGLFDAFSALCNNPRSSDFPFSIPCFPSSPPVSMHSSEDDERSIGCPSRFCAGEKTDRDLSHDSDAWGAMGVAGGPCFAGLFAARGAPYTGGAPAAVGRGAVCRSCLGNVMSKAGVEYTPSATFSAAAAGCRPSRASNFLRRVI